MVRISFLLGHLSKKFRPGSACALHLMSLFFLEKKAPGKQEAIGQNRNRNFEKYSNLYELVRHFGFASKILLISTYSIFYQMARFLKYSNQFTVHHLKRVLKNERFREVGNQEMNVCIWDHALIWGSVMTLLERNSEVIEEGKRRQWSWVLYLMR